MRGGRQRLSQEQIGYTFSRTPFILSALGSYRVKPPALCVRFFLSDRFLATAADASLQSRTTCVLLYCGIVARNRRGLAETRARPVC